MLRRIDSVPVNVVPICHQNTPNRTVMVNYARFCAHPDQQDQFSDSLVTGLASDEPFSRSAK